MLTGAAQKAYTANKDKATRNLITSANKKFAFGELKHALGPFVDYLEGNLSVPDNAPGWCEAVPRTGYSDRLNLSG